MTALQVAYGVGLFLAGLLSKALFEWVKTAATKSEAHAFRELSHAEWRGATDATLKMIDRSLVLHGEALNRIERRIDELPCGNCKPGGSGRRRTVERAMGDS